MQKFPKIVSRLFISFHLFMQFSSHGSFHLNSVDLCVGPNIYCYWRSFKIENKAANGLYKVRRGMYVCFAKDDDDNVFQLFCLWWMCSLWLPRKYKICTYIEPALQTRVLKFTDTNGREFSSTV